MTVTLTLEGGNLVWRTPYSPLLIEELKAQIPSTDRQWDKARKAWIVTPAHAQTLVSLTQDHLGITLAMPRISTVNAKLEQRLLDVRYVGACKDRGSERSAFGWADGGWTVVFPEKTLRSWFGDDSRPDESQTLYATLGVANSVSAHELRSAHRRLARQWHPDVCREPDAAEQFKRIQHAYEILADPSTRARYDAGLRLAGTVRSQGARVGDTPLYRPPLRCGYILAEGKLVLSRFVVEQIDAWEDITNSTGQTLVTTWPAGADAFIEQWI